VRQALAEFVREVRAAGLPVSVAEAIDSLRAAGVAGVERDHLREALAAALVKDETDRDVFDEVFDRFFAAAEERVAKKKRKAASGGLGDSPRRASSTRGGAAESKEPRKTPTLPRPESAEKRTERSSALERRARMRRLLAKPFRDLDPLEAEELRALAESLARRLRGRLRRRLRPSSRRGRLDFRRTLRRSISRGGAPVELELRRRRPGRIDLAALCDVSGSVRHASDFFAALLGPCRDLLRSFRLFVFVDHAIEASVEDGRLVPYGPVDVHAFSDLGQTLVEFERSVSPALGRNTVLLVLGDARNNRRPARADALARLRSRTRAVWWLVPEVRSRWGQGDSAIEAYRPHCDELFDAASGADLIAALERLGR
jgi:uncharacterized protein with von Willebrand factor type A (vWA) domain